MSDEVDVIVAGHTQTRLNLEVPNRSGGGSKLVVEALSYGTAFDQVDMEVDRRTGQVVRRDARTPTTWSDEVEPEPRVGRLVRRYVERVAPLAKRVMARARHAVTRPDVVPGKRPRGLNAIVADAQRELAGADVAFVNPGNMRGNLPRGAIAFEDLFKVAAYEHQVMRMELSGQDILRLLAQQATPQPAVWLHASGLRFTWLGAGIGNVVTGHGRPLEPRRTYTVAANELLVGTERFSVFSQRGRKVRAVGTDLEALARHVKGMKGPIDGS
jgi:5'-nucleotidase